MSTVKVSVGGNPIPHCDVSDTGANLHDLTGNLMTDYARKPDGQASCLDMLNGQPGTTRENTRDGFARSGNWIGNIIQLERRLRPSENQCFHSSLPGSDAILISET